MANFFITTTGSVATVIIEDLHLTLSHPQTIDAINDVTEKFTWAEIMESNDLQTAIDAGEIVCTDDSANAMNEITLDHINSALNASGANLTYTPTTTGGTVNSDSGTNASIPSANATNAGLMLPADKVKSDLVSVTQAVDLDELEAESASLVSLSGVTSDATDLGVFPGTTIADNETVKGALEDLEAAVEAITSDGNETPVVRGDSTTGVAPTVGEVPTPEAGDTASIFLTDGQLEKWSYNGTAWALAYTLTANEATDLGVTVSPTNVTITSSTGTDVVIPIATAVNAGLLAPSDFSKLGFISVTQAVDLDELEAEAGNLVTLTGQVSDATDLGTFTGSTIADGSTITSALQSIETALEAISGITNLGYTASPTNGVVISDTGTNATIPLSTTVNSGLQSPADKTKSDFITVTQNVDLDAMEQDIADHQSVLGVADGTTDLGAFTGATITDASDIKTALQELETAIEAGTDDQNSSEISIADAGGLYTGTDVEAALQEVGQDAADLRTSLGTVDGATDMGTYTGNIISDNQTAKQNIQELETELEARVYGTNFNLLQSAAVSTTTLNTFQSKINGSTSALEAGDYKILISYSWNHNATQNDFEGRFLFDGIAVGQNASGLIHKAEPKDAGGNFSGTGSNQQFTFTQAYYITGVTAGVKTVALDYRTDLAGVASSIWDCSIEIVRCA